VRRCRREHLRFRYGELCFVVGGARALLAAPAAHHLVRAGRPRLFCACHHVSPRPVWIHNGLARRDMRSTRPQHRSPIILGRQVRARVSAWACSGLCAHTASRTGAGGACMCTCLQHPLQDGVALIDGSAQDIAQDGAGELPFTLVKFAPGLLVPQRSAYIPSTCVRTSRPPVHLCARRAPGGGGVTRGAAAELLSKRKVLGMSLCRAVVAAAGGARAGWLARGRAVQRSSRSQQAALR